MKRNRIIFFVSLFIVLEFIAVVIALWPVFFYEKKGRPCELRLGIIPEISKGTSRKEWEKFFESLSGETDYVIRPYYANSTEEAMSGFSSGSLDMLYVNAALFLELQKNKSAEALVYHKMPDEQKNKNRAALVAKGKLKYISDTKGLRISFTDRYSITGYMVPFKYLRDKLRTAPDKWFSEISYTGNEQQAIEKLRRGETDIIAVSLLTLNFFLVEAGRDSDLKWSAMWVSFQLPESLICVSSASPFLKSEALNKLKNFLWNASKKRQQEGQSFNIMSLAFEPVGFAYNERLEALRKFMVAPGGTHNNKSDILMEAGSDVR